MITTKYLQFWDDTVDKKAKTRTIAVFNKRSGVRLGTIKWYGWWRCYVFVPMRDTIYNAACMQVIIAVINSLTEMRNEKLSDPS